jgi:hypothetical protein
MHGCKKRNAPGFVFFVNMKKRLLMRISGKRPTVFKPSYKKEPVPSQIPIPVYYQASKHCKPPKRTLAFGESNTYGWERFANELWFNAL